MDIIVCISIAEYLWSGSKLMCRFCWLVKTRKTENWDCLNVNLFSVLFGKFYCIVLNTVDDCVCVCVLVVCVCEYIFFFVVSRLFYASSFSWYPLRYVCLFVKQFHFVFSIFGFGFVRFFFYSSPFASLLSLFFILFYSSFGLRSHSLQLLLYAIDMYHVHSCHLKHLDDSFYLLGVVAILLVYLSYVCSDSEWNVCVCVCASIPFHCICVCVYLFAKQYEG